MKRYEEDDIMTCYFVIYRDGNMNVIRGWSDDKDYVKAYMDFHNCKKYKIKKMTDTFKRVSQILEENINDEINIYNINARSNKKKESSRSMIIPMTETEHVLVNEESNTFLASRVNYGYINDCMYYLKGKYQRVLKDIMLEDVMKNVIYNKHTELTINLEMDDLMTLYMSLPDQFDK